MITDLPDTTTSAIAHTIHEFHQEHGEVASGRVLTMLISTDAAHLEEALRTANAASREHPCRVIAVQTCDDEQDAADDQDDRLANLDAQVRFGSDAGAGEIIVLKPHHALTSHPDTLVIPLLVPDAPVVAWWPTAAPANPSQDPLGVMARRRITDVMRSQDPQQAFAELRTHYAGQDIDLSWTRLTVWRALLVSMLDQPPHLPIQSVRVRGQSQSLPLDLLGAWIAGQMDAPVHIERSDAMRGVEGVFFDREDGTLSMERVNGRPATISRPGEATQTVSLPMRTLEDCLSEELRRLNPDEVYAEVISHGWSLVHHG